MYKSSVTVHNLDPEVKDWLLVQSTEQGCSMSAIVRNILHAAHIQENSPFNYQEQPPQVDRQDSPENLAEAIRKRFEPLGGMELDLPPRGFQHCD